MQPTTAPPAVTPSALGQLTGFVQPAATHPFWLILSLVPPEERRMLIHIGKLLPSTIDTS